MRYQSTVISQLLKAVPRGWFEREARRFKSGRAKRTLSPWGHLVAMVLAQASGASSLRDLERLIERQGSAAAHLGLGRVRRATLADANATRQPELFAAAKLATLLPAGARGREALRLIDATRIFAGRRVAAWARDGVKLHLAFDPDDERLAWFEVTGERTNDITAARRMPIEPGATYVFDKGYYDFAFWADLQAAGCRFVTRLKRKTRLRPLAEIPAIGDNVLSDSLVRLSETLCGHKPNPFQGAVRLVRIRIDNGRELTLLTNDLATPAPEIAALYKARWQIELFFKWLKQNLKLARFLGASRNAVTIQILSALIVYLLVKLASLAHGAVLGLQASCVCCPRRSLRDVHSRTLPSRLIQPFVRRLILSWISPMLSRTAVGQARP